jgi:class 3 adenylate cyclase
MPAASGRRPPSRTDDPSGDGGPDEAVAVIAESVVGLARLARRHRLEMLVRLLEMTQMEAQEYLRLRSKRNLS